MSEASKPSSPSASVSIARQPIFDENRRLWGYELFCVGEGLSAKPEVETENTAISVAASAYMGIQQILRQGQKIMLNFDEMGILDDMPYALPPVNAAVQVDERVFLRPDIPAMLERLKSDGYLIAVRGFSGQPQFDPLYGGYHCRTGDRQTKGSGGGPSGNHPRCGCPAAGPASR